MTCCRKTSAAVDIIIHLYDSYIAFYIYVFKIESEMLVLSVFIINYIALGAISKPA